jgi:hypothetical protein
MLSYNELEKTLNDIDKLQNDIGPHVNNMSHSDKIIESFNTVKKFIHRQLTAYELESKEGLQ